MKVSLYVRLSEDAHGNELGVERQINECREYAETRGWSVGEVFIDNDLSATTGVERPEFERLLASQPESILCWHLDRLLRVSSDLERVIALNVNVFSKEAGWFDLSTPAGRAVARTVTAWSTYEGEQKAARQKAAHRQRVDAGGMTATGRPWWPTRPLGFNLDGTHHDEEAPALREVYDHILRGGTLAGSVRYLDELGIVTQRSLDLDAKAAAEEGREPVGRPWRASSLRPVLLNARNAGIYVYNGEEIGEAAWEPIVTEEVFRAVVRIVTNPARRLNGEASGGFGHRTNLLTGLASCSLCGHTVRAAWRRNAAGERAYKVYQCGGCKKVTLRAEWADSVVTREVIERVEQWQDELPKPDQAPIDVASLHTQLKALDASKQELAEDRALGLIDREQLRLGTARANEEIAKITDQLAEHGTGDDGPLFWDPDTLWQWTGDEAGEGYDVERLTPIIKRVCRSIVLTGPGKGRKDLLYGQHLVIEFHEPT
ncbi:recombinase family protein [Nocardioides sp. QY071]|uniref:recombinase family protein n=1 Tax=Nocardioides sp. QY071 TaxID=3044187 RepID=UPI00249AA48B|nr:recombinase family protein [Nocardioides sp. QY071]WGY03665.1 recombinase family protein [Nocardioides sp. QY071]